jgi:large subunit ribosomal protein L13
MKIIDGENAVLGRLASFVAKESLKGEEIVILNSEKVIISGKRKSIENEMKVKRARKGSSQKSPLYPTQSFKIVKRTIRGMLPNARTGRGREALNRIKCYNGMPKEFEKSEKMKIHSDKKIKSFELNSILKNI